MASSLGLMSASSFFGQTKGLSAADQQTEASTSSSHTVSYSISPRSFASLAIATDSEPSASPAEEWWKKPCKSKSPAPSFSNTMAADFFKERPFELQQGFPFNTEQQNAEKEHVFVEPQTNKKGVPVYVMLPLDSVNANNQVSRKRALNASFLALKNAGVEGIMMDVWWGIVEKDGPLQYNWSGYRELLEMAKEHGLKVQAVMSFHQCGGNVGDSCTIPLPEWVVEEINKNPNMVYTDKSGRRNYEYLSLGCDTFPVLRGRTPVQAYSDYMRSFRDCFKDLLGDVIVEIQVGMGPAGELRYPGYPERDGIWKFPGIGEFQCYDKYMLASLKACAIAVGKEDWGRGGPTDAGGYNQWPEDNPFFKRSGGWSSEYGKFFLEWYSGQLLEHGERVVTAAEGIFRGFPVRLSGKVAGIHWHYGTRSHPPELTAGYYNTRTRDGYLLIAKMFGRHGVTFNFTCFEMRDKEQPEHALCSPEGLLRQVTMATRNAGVSLAGENALPRFDDCAFEQIVSKSSLPAEDGGKLLPLSSFTYLRMSDRLFQVDNWRRFVSFVRQMDTGISRKFEDWEEEVSKPLIQEAAAALV